MQRSIQELQMLQALPLKVKVEKTKQRIREWVDEFGIDGVYVSFSGGKDSTVLLTIAREMYPDIKAMFVDTGLEYPEIREFVKTWDNVDWVRPKMNFRQVIEKYGYPMISKEVSECVYGARRYLERMMEESGNTADLPWQQFYRKLCGVGEYSSRGGSTLLRSALQTDREHAMDNVRVKRMMGVLSKTNEVMDKSDTKDRSRYSCEKYQFFLDAPFEIHSYCCRIMKKNPSKLYGRQTNRKPILAMMASESKLRTQGWLKTGCNAFDAKKQQSNPMAFWTEQDVLLYIYKHDIKIASIYGDVVKENEVEGQLDLEDLGLFEFDRPILTTTGAERTGCMFCGFGCHLEKSPNRFEQMKITHPKQYEWIMKPWDEGGLGYKDVIDWINENGNMDIKY